MTHTKQIARIVVAMLLVLSVVAPVAGTATPVRPNIVFIMADDLGWRDLGCYGSRFHQTPNLDRLAARGVRFTQAYAANPLCSPTRSSVLTGLWPARTGITAPACHVPQVVLDKQLVKGNPNMPVLVANSVTRLKTDYVTLPKVLHDAGYRTGHFGKWHLGAEPYSALQHGFDVDWPHWPGPGPAGSYVAPWKFPPALRVESKPGEHIEDAVSSHVVEFIRGNRDRPFYVNYWPFSVHAPYDAKDELVAKYRKLADPNNPQRNPVYAAMVESLDDGVGRVLAALEECGVADRTIIVFFSDNGGISWAGSSGDAKHKSARFQADMTAPPTSNLPLRNGKASLYEGGVREPCIVVWPGVTKPGTTNDTVIQSIDWMPTLLDMASVPLPANAKPDGVSIAPVLKGTRLARNTIFCHFPHDTPASGQHPGTSVRRGDWKLIRLHAQNDDGTDQFELYNLRDDPGELKNLAAEKPELVRELNALITEFLAATEAVVPVRNPNYRKAVDRDAGERPNILLILADDLGWSDLGCYGGEIRTPNLDSLARGGLRFTQFYNSARCSPSRAAILTGLHPHQAGFPNLSGVLPAHCVTIPEMLEPAGYRSYMVGKWHLSRESTPVQRGFDEFYGMLGGFNTFWKEDPYYTRLPGDRSKRVYAPDAFYSTDVFGDYALDFLEDARRSGKPWFFYLAFNAPHFPLHAREEDIARYESLYAQGWDRIREQRLARQKGLGLVPADLKLTPRSNIPANQFNTRTGWADKDNPAWDSLPADRRADLARRMAVFAAMVDCMDRNIGRVLARLKETGQFDNTLIVFLSDNGACAEWDPWGFDEVSGPKNVLHTGDDLKKVGGPDSYVSYGSGWANACNTPWRLYKHYGHEGGINTPLIVHWPAGLKTKPGAVAREAGHITDLLPTVLELAGASYPQERKAQKVLPLEGVSLVPVFRGERLAPRRIFMEHEGNRAVREGRWKLVALKDRLWELYDLDADPTEMNDLAAREADRVAHLAQAWEDWADRCSVRERSASQSQGTPQIANKSLAITCEIEPQSRDGVILAQGGDRQGYALWLRDGRLFFGVRIDGKLTSIAADDIPSGRVALSARLTRNGTMQLSVNGRMAAQGKAPGLIPAQPVDELSISQDVRTAVGDYDAPYPLRGKVEKVNIVAE